MHCGQCQATVTADARFCPQCGAAIARAPSAPDSHVPACPRCGAPVRAESEGPFPRQQEGVISVTPWNDGWDGACHRCGLRFEAEYVLSTRDPRIAWGFVRRAVFRHGSSVEWQGLDLQQVLAGISITIDTTGWRGGQDHQEIVLTLGEAQALCRALQGPLRILTEQRDWTWDTT